MQSGITAEKRTWHMTSLQSALHLVFSMGGGMKRQTGVAREQVAVFLLIAAVAFGWWFWNRPEAQLRREAAEIRKTLPKTQNDIRWHRIETDGKVATMYMTLLKTQREIDEAQTSVEEMAKALDKGLSMMMCIRHAKQFRRGIRLKLVLSTQDGKPFP
ncbi:MAG: hypothetical protein LBL69_02715, partial [Zoogloeaceae bacterium]|nr:hypothetical protein [Zoogloeaceae bacterium]